ncbi:trehalose-6-phosphate synthase [Allokutzneria sp. A3M-2-11 16]|uniref:trehalose-6-phosphate synthase n=1 Tax=Allokutzneria sp. A3M-2-11 16 TaxID=2962043 RepID=UPI0020B7726C|nr:trehalose-6-phosphate synthase [Allokutzneria sp. A3M-2-11 16]MCP3803626.1 trehalose-6-phosphate synthase [Allokutzneria sp. A3M-2-11 16]
MTHLFLASKRAAVTYAPDPETGELRPWLAPGGTGNVVAEQAGVLNVSWIASADTDDDRRAAQENPDGLMLSLHSGREINVRLIQHDRTTFDVVQNFLTAELLWAANNYGWDRWRTPTFGAETYEAMRRFGEFTDDFADAMLKSSAGVDDPVYLVHDYQLVGVPAKLRAQRPDAPILLFVHIPWPSPDYWRILPKEMRVRLLEGMLPATTIGFFADRWTRNFLDCVADLLPEANVDRESGVVHWRGRRTHVRTMPLGYSPLTLHGRNPRLPEGVAEWAGDGQLVVHSGRTDPMKNAERAVRAFVLAVRSDERLRGVKMLVRMNPNRLYVEANAEYVRRVEAAVAEANAELGADTVRSHCDNEVDHSVACFQRADLLMFNSTVDGQNLSTFEAPLVNERNAPVILSEMCGAAEVLAPVCDTVNPFDLVEQAQAIVDGLTAPEEERAEAAKRRREVAEPWTLEAWVRMQLDGLTADHEARDE